MKILLSLLVLAFAIFSCQEQQEEKIDAQEKLVFKPTFDGLEAFLNYQEKIEEKKNLKILPSLLFTHKSGYTIQNNVFLDKNGEVLKATQEQITTDGKKTVLTFYFLKEVLSMVQITEENMRLSTLRIKQTRVFYDANQRPITAYSRITNGTNKAEFHQVKLQKAQHKLIENNLHMLSDMQNQEEEFALYFQGFDEAFNKQFVQFGNNSFSTNLAFAPKEKLITELQANPTLFKNQIFNIQHQAIQEANGLQYQVLVGISKR